MEDDGADAVEDLHHDDNDNSDDDDDDDIDEEDVDDGDDPPPPPLAEVSRFDQALQSLQSSETQTFMLRQAVSGLEDRLTIPQVRALTQALSSSTCSVTSLVTNLKFCSLPAVGLLVDFIRTSPPRLTELWAGYAARPTDSQEIQQSYKAQLDRLFHAVQENPNITTINCLSLADSIFDLLSKSTSLTEFRAAGQSITAEMALSVAAGLCRSPSVTKIALGVESGPLDIILSGIGASRVESVTCWHGQANVAFWESISKLLLFTPTLNDLNVADATQSDTQGGLGRIFTDFRHPASAGLKSFHLEGVCLADQTTDDDDDDSESNALEIVPVEQANTSLDKLALLGVRFRKPRDVRLLSNVVGLKELVISSPTLVEEEIGDDDDEDEDYDVPQFDPEDWSLFIRRNAEIDKMELMIREGEDQGYLGGILEGARGTALSTLTFSCHRGQIETPTMERLCRVIPTLQELHFSWASFGPAGASQLAYVLRGQNPALKVLHFKCCLMGSDFRGLTFLVESLLFNETLQELVFESLQLVEPMTGTFCQTLSRVFSSNKSLVKFQVSNVDLRQGRLAESLIGLQENRTLKILIFDECPIDNEAMTALGQALESTEIALTEIGLPKNSIGLPVLVDLEQGMRSFLESLSRMPTIQKVHFGSTMRELNHEWRSLLLLAVKQNKNLKSFNLRDYRIRAEDASAASDIASIEYYLKLNQFGRRLLDSTNILTSLWPKVLAPMTRKQEDAGALFFFIRQYFSRQTAPARSASSESERQPRNEPDEQPPQKKARRA